jgi:hypothetical protein
MSGLPRKWQAQIEIGDHQDPVLSYRSVCVYGETVKALHAAARAYLLRQKLARFRSLGDHLVGRTTYFYSYGIPRYDEIAFFQGPLLAKGWWYQKETVRYGTPYEPESQPPEKLASYEAAVDHFIAHALIPEKGPDYRSRAVVGSELRLPFLERVLREGDEEPINDLIKRGWHIIALEYKGELSTTGELLNRKAVFVMGHPEGHAATLTLNADYYQKR